jgi:hypothetical protein
MPSSHVSLSDSSLILAEKVTSQTHPDIYLLERVNKQVPSGNLG